MLEAVMESVASPEAVEQFIHRWKNTTGTEKANCQIFLTELCSLLDLPQPDPASNDNAANTYVFERRVAISNPDGSENRGFIDLYRQGSFVLEAKQTGKGIQTAGWDKAMQAAYNQADQYVRALTAEEGRPPFIVVTDVGRTLALYAEFSCSGGTYVPFPNPRNHRIHLEDLREPHIQQRLKLLWEAPEKLDPTKYASRVTHKVSEKLATLARILEADGYEVSRVAHFLKRCLFTMFSEDVELLPKGSFTDLLKRLKDTPERFPKAVGSLWASMNSGGFCGVLMQDILQFNGGLFKDIEPIPLKTVQIQLLIDAAKADWRFVEPAIFGTLLERALDPRERHKLGAHYTPRTYVERLVMPTLIEPLRAEWGNAQVVAETHLQQGKQKKALETLRQFHFHLCQVRVLDPACGSANFLYVCLEHMKRLEGEVLNLISGLGGGQDVLDAEGFTVSPHQLLGLEINPRAAAIAEIVLWIGYLQWHYRIHGKLDLPEPILQDFHNIENRDALIEYESREPDLDASGQPITIWDGISMKPSPVTNSLVPDENGRTAIYRYSKVRRAKWPEADYIVGNPPFIGASAMRRALGDGYVDAVRKAYDGAVPSSSDFVMYWWYVAAERVRDGHSRSFGFITTNSLRQTFNRRVTDAFLGDSKKPLSLAYSVPDHPWVDGNDGAAVRIAMTVGVAGKKQGFLQEVVTEQSGEDDARVVRLIGRSGKIHSNLSVGAAVSATAGLLSNAGLAIKGFELGSQGFLVPAPDAELLLEKESCAKTVLKPYMNGNDLINGKVERYVIDFYGLDETESQAHGPLYQHVLDHVRPYRKVNRESRTATKWWVFRRSGADLRNAISGLERYIATTRTAKHRLFQFVPGNLVAESKIVAIALESPLHLGVLSSRIHVIWALAQGSMVESRPNYNHTECFNRFPFPEPSKTHSDAICALAERLDAHRKRQQTEFPWLTLTAIYNVVERLNRGEPLSAKEKVIHEQGLVSMLKEIHDELDHAVLEAYGWSDLAENLVGLPGATTPFIDKPQSQAEAEEELLARIVSLNQQRAAAEAVGNVGWLRPDYQAPGEANIDSRLAFQTHAQAESRPVVERAKVLWPKDLPSQVTILRDTLAFNAHTTDSLASQFKQKPKKSISQVLAALVALGQVQSDGEVWRLIK
ncbi:class I SAM-dependent DNA methyltransferase [Marinobacter sp. GN3S48]|uniref:class I SAM-dependent DNA methyltransferase n=1 Tax=Marinobacter sp. GN3S48 TaxID=3382302 RepID=UPI00387AC64A